MDISRTKLTPRTATFVGIFLCLLAISACQRTSDKPAPATPEAVPPPQRDYRAEWRNFKLAVEDKILANQHRIDSLHVRAASLAKKKRNEFDARIDTLEKRNRALDRKIATYEDKGEEAWTGSNVNSHTIWKNSLKRSRTSPLTTFHKSADRQ